MTDQEWARILDTAAGERGDHEEEGPNRGTCLKYQKATGNGPGDSWCASFIVWLLLTVLGAERLHVPGFMRTGSCAILYNALKRAGHARATPSARCLLFWVNAAGVPHHVALIARDPATAEDEALGDTVAGTFPTWEGNTNLTHSPEGTGVYDLHRGGPDDARAYVYADISWL